MTKLRSAEEIAAQIQIEKEKVNGFYGLLNPQDAFLYELLCVAERILFKDKDTGASDE